MVWAEDINWEVNIHVVGKVVGLAEVTRVGEREKRLRLPLLEAEMERSRLKKRRSVSEVRGRLERELC